MVFLTEGRPRGAAGMHFQRLPGQPDNKGRFAEGLAGEFYSRA